ncbi:MAG: Mth938-like domain-containing protein [Gammaproteobacteria bacterium]|nr:MAG: Mth938-like domain-containing protein [Gammaproteobacteria bacterium]
MKIHLQTGTRNQMLIHGYAPGEIIINQQRYQGSLIITPDAVIPEWTASSADTLTQAQLQVLLQLSPEILLLGTGRNLNFPSSETMKSVIQANIGYEIMDTAAACRTFNILMGEGRHVVAGLMEIVE